MDGQRQQYIPAPPPPRSLSQNGPQSHLLPVIPPPPPRLQQTSGHGNIAFPPPPPHPSSAYGAQPSWQRIYPPPPPLMTGQNQYSHLSYSSHGRTPAPLKIPPPPTDRPPLVSATYIPEGGTFGPGVGIPPLFTSDLSAYPGNLDEAPRHGRKQSYGDGFGQEHQNDHSHTYRPTHENIPSGPPTATLHNPHGQASSSNYSHLDPSHYYTAGGPSPHDLGDRWPLDHVLLWLAQNGFSREWQETFKALDMKGADFIELGRRGKMGKFHQIVYPQLGKECAKSEIPYDQTREREEGKRLLKLVRAIAEANDPDYASMLPSASTDGNLENSPNLGREILSAFPGSAVAENSPGQQFAKPANLSPAQGRFTASLAPSNAGHGAYDRPPNESSHPDQNSRSDYTRNILSYVGERRRHSPSGSVDTGVPPGQRPSDAKSYSGSPVPQVASLVPGESAPSGDGTYSKRYSSDSAMMSRGLSSQGRSGTAGSPGDISGSDRLHPSRRHGTDPSPQEQSFRDGHSKDHSKGLLNMFRKKKPYDSMHPSPEETHPDDSPTSLGGARHPTPSSALGRPAYNGGDMSIMSGSISDHERNQPQTKMVVATPPPKRFILATLDGWNYRLIDVSDVDAADTLRAVICKGVGIRDPGSAQIYLTEPGQMVHEEPLSDTMLVVNRRSKSDAQASLKFFVHSITPRPPNSRTPQSAGLGLSFDDRQRRNGGLDDPASLRPGRSPAGHYFPYIPSWPSLDEDDSLGDPMPDAGGGAASLASHEEHRKAVDRKNASQRKATSNGAQTTTKRDAVIDFDSPRISPYDERKLDNLVPFRKPPSAPTESNTLAKVNSLTKKPVKRNSGSHTDEQKEGSKGSDDRPRPLMLQTKAMTEKPGHSLAAALANVGKMSGSIGQPANTPVTPVDPKNGKQDSSPERHKSPISPPKLPQIQTGGDPLFRSLNFKGRKAPGGTGQAGGPGSPSLKTTGPDFDFKEAEVSFAKSPVPQDDSDDDSDDGLFAIPLANKPKVPKEKKPKDGQSDNKEPSTKPSLTVDTEPRAAKTRSVAFKSPSTAGEPSAGPSAHSAGTDHSEGHSAYTPNDGGVEVSTPDSSRNYRRESFVRDDVWASRPPVDGMLEHLDDFFPNIDLDEPYLEAIPQSPPVSPTSTPVRDESLTGVPTLPDRTLQSSPSMLSDSHVQDSSDTLGSNESTLKPRNSSVAQRNLAKSGGLSRVKTIREIARGAQQVRRRQSTVDTTAKYQTPLRRKSTKMFGARIMQISPQPGSRLSALDPLPQHHSVRDKLPQQQPTFRIIRGQLIGKGTYGKVYLGINADTGEILAVKLVEFGPKTTGNDRDRMREMVAAIDQEIDTMQHLEHPNIVQYLGCERAELSMSIYLEYIPGGSIGSCLRKHGKFEESVVKSLNRQVLCGLAYLHDQGILHRDLKADNILLDLDGTCKISDFGISKKTDNIYGNDVTNSMQGSVFWMAPEVVQSQGQGYSAKVDIWSLGCVVLEMFAGRRPWSTEEAIGAIFKLGSLNQAPPIPEDVSLNISPPALAFMLDCFTIDTFDRPTADTLLSHHPFCIPDPNFNFSDTELHAKIRHVL